MSRYQERSEGVYDTVLARVITRRDVDAWALYCAWLSLPGNEPAPMPPALIRNLDEENRKARVRRAILLLERSQARPLRELAIGTQAEKLAATQRLREIDDQIKTYRAEIGANASKGP